MNTAVMIALIFKQGASGVTVTRSPFKRGKVWDATYKPVHDASYKPIAASPTYKPAHGRAA